MLTPKIFVAVLAGLKLADTYPIEKRDDPASTVTIFTSTDISTVTHTVHATHNPTPSSDAVAMSSMISSELASASASASDSAVSSGSSASSSAASATSAASSAPSPVSQSKSGSGFFNWPVNGVQGVNLGGWLVLEPWINTDLFSTDNFPDGNIPVDEFNFCDDLGDKAGDLLEKHYSSWITGDDFAKMKGYGLNAVRIPIGYWAYKLMSTDKYYKGKQDDYLEKAIGWARDNNMYVLIDLHGAPGSQNGYDSSGHKNFHDWSGYNNTDETVDVLQNIFHKYGGNDYKDVVIGIELVNEPLVGGDNGVSQDYVSDFYNKVIDLVDTDDDSTNNVVLHDGYMYQGAWKGKSYNDKPNTVYDTHLYMLYDSGYIAKSYDEKIDQVCTWGEEIETLSYKEFVGEFTAAWDANSSSIYTQKIDQWGDSDKDKIRKFVEAEFTAFEKTRGWFFWNWKMGNSDQWDFQVLVENGIIPQPLTNRKFTTC